MRGKASVLGNGMHVDICFQTMRCILGCTSLSVHGNTHSLCSPISLSNIYCPDIETHHELTIMKLTRSLYPGNLGQISI